MPQYFLTMPHDTADEPTMESMAEMDPAELEAIIAAVDELNTALTEAGAWVTAGGLHPPSTAITVDATGDAPVHHPGPFVEATQYVGGYWVIEAPDQQAALGWAERCSAAVQSRIEVRALQEAPQ
ncbi:YciI family protein [Nocardioides aequoreus]|uniref:YciI family protein n=1 Tax=Nocardioides aequoreus TaxID=397278 RepID=UPI0004C3264D|nr:YciI family protein [Nocardioides aequoreus]